MAVAGFDVQVSDHVPMCAVAAVSTAVNSQRRITIAGSALMLQAQHSVRVLPVGRLEIYSIPSAASLERLVSTLVSSS